MARKSVRIVLIAVAVVVVVLGVGFWWYFIRNNAPAKLRLQATDTGVSSAQAVPLDGTWTVDPSKSTAGYRINEQFVAGSVSHTAVGRTNKVTGTFVIQGTSVPSGQVTVDVRSVEFSDSPPGLDVASRAATLRRQALQTDQFPSSAFTITQPISFGTIPTPGQIVRVQVTGNLTLHGVTKPVQMTVDARRNGSFLELSTTDVPIELADYNISKPRFGPVADVAGQGVFEFKVRFVKK